MAVSAQTSAKLSAAAKSMPRDAKGHFIKKGAEPVAAVATTSKTESPLPLIETPPSPPTPSVEKVSDLDAPLVVVNNPFKKLMHWLDDIRRKQTTTFDFKVSVPLIALPIFLIVVGGALQYMFTLGKQSAQTALPSPTAAPISTPHPIQISKVGVIKGTYNTVLADEVTPTPSLVPTNTPFPATSTPLPTPTLPPSPTLTPTPTIPPTRFVLVDKNDNIFFLKTPKSMSLDRYVNKKVLVTGMYDPAKEMITIKKYADIEVLP